MSKKGGRGEREGEGVGKKLSGESTPTSLPWLLHFRYQSRANGPNFIWNSATPLFHCGHFFFLKRFLRFVSSSLSFFFFFFFNRSFLFANPCPKFDSGRNDVENVALLAKDIFFFSLPDENNKRIKPYIDSIPRLSRGLIFRRIYSYFYAKIKKEKEIKKEIRYI